MLPLDFGRVLLFFTSATLAAGFAPPRTPGFAADLAEGFMQACKIKLTRCGDQCGMITCGIKRDVAFAQLCDLRLIKRYVFNRVDNSLAHGGIGERSRGGDVRPSVVATIELCQHIRIVFMKKKQIM